MFKVLNFAWKKCWTWVQITGWDSVRGETSNQEAPPQTSMKLQKVKKKKIIAPQLEAFALLSPNLMWSGLVELGENVVSHCLCLALGYDFEWFVTSFGSLNFHAGPCWCFLLCCMHLSLKVCCICSHFHFRSSLLLSLWIQLLLHNKTQLPYHCSQIIYCFNSCFYIQVLRRINVDVLWKHGTC